MKQPDIQAHLVIELIGDLDTRAKLQLVAKLDVFAVVKGAQTKAGCNYPVLARRNGAGVNILNISFAEC